MGRPRSISDEAVLDAVIELALRVGPSRVTLATAAEACGLSSASLAQRFGSKRALLLAADKRAVGRWVDAFVKAEGATPLARIIDGLVQAMGPQSSPERIAHSLALLQLDLDDPDFHAETLRGAREVRRRLVTELEAAVAAGELRGGTDTAGLARLLETTYHGASIGWAIHREGSLEQWVRDQLDDVLAPHRTVGVKGSVGDRRRRPALEGTAGSSRSVSARSQVEHRAVSPDNS